MRSASCLAQASESLTPRTHGVLEAHSPARRLLIPAHGLHQHLHRVGVVHWHHAAADVVVGGVERDGEGELELLLGQLVDLRHEAAGGELMFRIPMFTPSGDEMFSRKRMTSSKLSSGSPMPISTMWRCAPRCPSGRCRSRSRSPPPRGCAPGPPGWRRRSGSPSGSPPGWTRRPCCRSGSA